MGEAIPTYSVSFRLQRTTTEFALVSVPVTGDLIVAQSDGTGRIDVEEIVRRAVELGHAADVVWQAEGQRVEPHPIQMPPPGLASDAQRAETGAAPDRGGE